MYRSTVILMALAAVWSSTTAASAPARPEVPEEYRVKKLATQSLDGPRFGFTLFSGDVADKREAAGLEPMMTQFGWQFEKQLVSATDGSQALMEWVFLFGGLEQDELNFSVSWLAGYRLSNGLELGVGPNFTLNPDNEEESSKSMIFAFGTTIPVGDFYVPLNLAIGVAQGGPRFNILTGWVVG